MLHKWKLKEMQYVFNGWVHVTSVFVQVRHKVEHLMQRIHERLVVYVFRIWKDATKQESHYKHVLHKFVLRLKNGSVNRTFNTWKEATQQAVSDRYKIHKFLHYFKNKTVVNCMRAWKYYVKDKIALRTNLEGIDKYVLLERSIAAWRFLTQRRRLHQRTGAVILRSTKQRVLR